MGKAQKRSRRIEPLPKRVARVLARLKSVPGLDESEKALHALGLAATPQERWDLHEQHVRSLGYWKPLKKKKSATP